MNSIGKVGGGLPCYPRRTPLTSFFHSLELAGDPNVAPEPGKYFMDDSQTSAALFTNVPVY